MFSTAALNLMANHIADRTISVRIHSDDPGTSGTANRIGSNQATVLAAGWTDAASGTVENREAISLGQITSATTVKWYSLWDGSTFLGRDKINGDTGVVVAANEAFEIDARTIDLMLTTS